MESSAHIQRAIDWIEENLRCDISPDEAARIAGFSPFYFCRLFAASTGLSVMRFITQRRLSHAAYEISCGKRVIDAALEYGFDSASGFTRAFRREFGRSPREYARSIRPLPPARFILKELKHIMISHQLLTRALTAWNLTDEPRPLIHSGGARSENTFIVGPHLLHASENRASLALAMTAEHHLADAGLPAARTIPTASGAPIHELDALFFRLTDRLPGAFIPASGMYDPANARAVGEALARLHSALKPLETLPELHRVNLTESTLTWSLPQTAKAMNLPCKFAAAFSSAVSRLFPTLPVTPIHRNPTPEAFFFENGRLTGFSNFEMTEINLRLFDVCYAATAILSETLGRLPDETVSRWPEVLNAIVQGYHEAAPLTPAEFEAIPYVVCAVQMICVAFFSSQEQYRHLADVNIRMTRRIIEWLFPGSSS